MEFVMWRAIVSGLVLGCLAGNGAVRVARDGERWTLENAELRVTVDAVAGAITVADKGSRFVWTQMETKRTAFRGVKQIAGGIALDPARVAQEIALLADRLDVSEEVDRFRAHVAAFRETLAGAKDAAIGKRLGFLLQEMLREANTTGSKSRDATMLHDVVAVKEELERIAEQVENIE